jgi:hypothetical protein
MTYSNDEIKKFVDEIRIDVNDLKSKFNSLLNVLELDQKIDLFDTTKNSPKADNSPNPKLPIDCSKIKNKKIIAEVRDQAKPINKSLQKNFGLFCDSVSKLNEFITRLFLRKKFSELQSDQNKELIEALVWIENYYKTKGKTGWKFPSKYIYKTSRSVLQSRQQDGDKDDRYFPLPDREEYLDRDQLIKETFSFNLILSFYLLDPKKYSKIKTYTINDYKIAHNKKKIDLTSTFAIQRPSPPSNINTLDYYYRLDNAYKFRNTEAHNLKEDETKLSDYVEVDRDNYEGILEATQWFVEQIDLALTNKSNL